MRDINSTSTANTIQFKWIVPMKTSNIEVSLTWRPKEGTAPPATVWGNTLSGLTAGIQYDFNITLAFEADHDYPKKIIGIEAETVWTKPPMPGPMKSVKANISATPPQYRLTFIPSSPANVDSYMLKVVGYEGKQSNNTDMVMNLRDQDVYNYTITAVGLNGKDHRSKKRRGKFTLRPSEMEVVSKTPTTADVSWLLKAGIPYLGNLRGYRLDVTASSNCLSSQGFRCNVVVCEKCREKTIGGNQGCRFRQERMYTRQDLTTPGFKVTISLQDLPACCALDLTLTNIDQSRTGFKIQEQLQPHCEVPQKPLSMTVSPFGFDDYSTVSYEVTWKPGNYTGPTDYVVEVRPRGSRVASTVMAMKASHTQHMEYISSGYNNTTLIAPDLLAYWRYNVSVYANTSIGKSPPLYYEDIVLTPILYPGLAENLTVEQNTDRAHEFTLSFQCPPLHRWNGPLSHYSIRVLDIERKSYHLTRPFPITHSTTFCASRFVGHLDLRTVVDKTALGTNLVERNYSFQVQFSNDGFHGNFTEPVYKFFQPRVPIKEDLKRSLLQNDPQSGHQTITTSTVYIGLSMSTLLNSSQGKIKGAGLLVCVGSCIQTDLTDWQSKNIRRSVSYPVAKKSGFTKSYLTTPPNWHKQILDKRSQHNYWYNVGTDATCRQQPYCNGPLPSGRTIRITFVMCTDAGCNHVDQIFQTKVAEEKDSSTVIIVLIVIIIILILAAIALFVVWHFQNMRCHSSDLNDYDGGPRSSILGVHFSTHRDIPRSRPIAIAKFSDAVAKLHRDSDMRFQGQFQDIQKLSRCLKKCKTVEALKEANRGKNRYVDIIPYDHSRVKLSCQPEDDDGQDFINANYIAGYNSVREYIATQGPLPATILDFWQMVWEQKISVIVMLSDLKENGKVKVDQYWPDEEGAPFSYGVVDVELTQVFRKDKYLKRIFDVTQGTQSRAVSQYFLYGWMDHKANLTPDLLLEFINEVRREAESKNTGPILVHCSAGVGRTGTFITLDYFVQFIANHSEDDQLDIYGFVLQMRKNRVEMVQSESQYVFIFDTLKEVIEKTHGKHNTQQNGIPQEEEKQKQHEEHKKVLSVKKKNVEEKKEKEEKLGTPPQDLLKVGNFEDAKIQSSSAASLESISLGSVQSPSVENLGSAGNESTL